MILSNGRRGVFGKEGFAASGGPWIRYAVARADWRCAAAAGGIAGVVC
jgi:hypothetical protein